MVIQPTYRRAESFIDGLAVVMKKDSFGFIDKSGTIVIPIIYYTIGEFKDGVVYAKYKGSQLWLDKQGNEVLDPNQKTIDRVMSAAR